MFKISKYLSDRYILKTKTPRDWVWLRVLAMGVVGGAVGVVHGYDSCDRY
jgi:hypothetical protein